MTPIASQFSRASGTTLLEVVCAIALLSILASLSIPVVRSLDAWAVNAAARITERHLMTVRLRAAADRRLYRIRATPGGNLETLDNTGRVVGRLELAGPTARLVDSLRVRPRTIRYNPRGHGSAGSIYLYRNGRGVRLISNFVGRIRRHSFRF